MNKPILRGGFVCATLLALVTCQGCFELQRAAGCNNTGIFGCKDEPSEIQEPDPDLKRAPPGGRFPPTDREREQQPWATLIDDCMASGGQRTECIENLPPDILAQLEALESGNAAIRRRQLEASRSRLEALQPLWISTYESHQEMRLGTSHAGGFARCGLRAPSGRGSAA